MLSALAVLTAAVVLLSVDPTDAAALRRRRDRGMAAHQVAADRSFAALEANLERLARQAVRIRYC